MGFTALIPAGGPGARLDRKGTPKPLVEVGGQAIVARTIGHLHGAGVERFLIVTGYRGDELRRALLSHPALGALNLEFVHNHDWEKGLASSLLCAREHLQEPFILAMGDHLFERELIESLVSAPIEPDGVVVMADPDAAHVHELEMAVKLSTEGERVLACGRALDEYNAIDCGLFLATPALFEALSTEIGDGELFSAIQILALQDRVRAVWTEGRKWFDVDTPSSLVRAEMTIRAQARRGVVKPVDIPPMEGMAPIQYRFETGNAVHTEVIVKRGIVGNPASLDVIPEEHASSPHFVFSDPRVFALYGEAFVGSLESAGYDIRTVILPEGEASKTLANYAKCVDQVLTQGIDERSILISLGGGAICNVCGFIASTLYRGIGLVHFPTTLMAQCDAAISHKQAVNGSKGKNMVGSYYAPLKILVDVDVLGTLEAWQIPDGLAEVVKHALGQDKGYIEWLQGHDGDPREPEFLESVVKRNIELKCLLMKDDPKEHREGMVLQYGHTVGHPLEYLSGFTLSHGQAVAIGMMIAARVSRILGGCSDEEVRQHEALISQYGLPTTVPAEIDPDDVMEMMRFNKKYLTEGTRMALVNGPGTLWSVDGDYAIPVPDAIVRQALLATYGEGEEKV